MKRVVLVALTACIPLFFSACNGGKGTSSDAEQATSADAAAMPEPAEEPPVAGLTPPSVASGELRIAWVSLDTVIQSYDYYFELEKELKTLTEQAEKRVKTKGQALEKRIAKFQDDMQKGLMLRSEAQKMQETLAQEQQGFLAYQQQEQQRVVEEEQVRLRKVQNAITEYVARYNQTKGYSYIFSVPMLYADPAQNITQEVIDGLNREYAQRKKPKAE
ncbi:MAG: hypothetical protein CSA07_03245 [Bacteroidia bacterium]|nr:MAG: hypothetical protein CSA07_03245 [Bacteroidia bacterium]